MYYEFERSGVKLSTVDQLSLKTKMALSIAEFIEMNTS
jgi:hypothetical protein